MLTLFIIPSDSENADVEKTIDSFHNLPVHHKIVTVSSYMEINNYKNKDEWFGIFWDNERIDDGIKEALPVFLSYHNFEVLILYKKESKIEASWRDRIFRRGVYLLEDYKPHSLWLKKEAILDGWVLDHDDPS